MALKGYTHMSVKTVGAGLVFATFSLLILQAQAGTAPSAPKPVEPEADAGSQVAVEERIQGPWQAYIYGSDSKAWVISFDQSRFRAEGEAGDWYSGTVALRAESEPSELDFVIEDCECKYKGMTSQGIFRWEGESLVMATPEPGADRPTGFDESSGEMVELRRLE